MRYPPGARGRTPENWGLSAGERPLLAGQSGAHRRPSPPASDSIASPGDGPFTRWPRRVVRPIRHRRAAKHDPSAARLACDKSGPVRRLRCVERRPSSGGTACAAGVARAPSANGPASYSAACSHRRPYQWTNGPMRPHARALVMAGLRWAGHACGLRAGDGRSAERVAPRSLLRRLACALLRARRCLLRTPLLPPALLPPALLPPALLPPALLTKVLLPLSSSAPPQPSPTPRALPSLAGTSARATPRRPVMPRPAAPPPPPPTPSPPPFRRPLTPSLRTVKTPFEL